MPDSKYCYPDSEVLKNKLNITDENELFEAEKELTAIRLKELQDKPINWSEKTKEVDDIVIDTEVSGWKH